MEEEKDFQVFIGGIQKFAKDRDFAKFIEKTIPEYKDIVYGISKKKQASGLIVRLLSLDAKLVFIEKMTGKVFKNRPLRVRVQDPLVAAKHFVPMQKLLKPRSNELPKVSEEDIKKEMEKDIKDKLIPYHNVPYDQQIRNKEEHLKEIFRKFVKRVETVVNHNQEPKMPVWMTNYWNGPKNNSSKEESKEEQDAEEIDKSLPCAFTDVII